MTVTGGGLVRRCRFVLLSATTSRICRTQHDQNPQAFGSLKGFKAKWFKCRPSEPRSSRQIPTKLQSNWVCLQVLFHGGDHVGDHPWLQLSLLELNSQDGLFGLKGPIFYPSLGSNMEL